MKIRRVWSLECRNLLRGSLCRPFQQLFTIRYQIRLASSTLRVGGRTSPLGFSHPLGKSPQVKQGRPMGVVKRIPGTTRVEYTNKKGRVFTFRIPVTELTHPPVQQPSFLSGHWKEIDTSFCDTGELESCIPSPIEDYLRQRVAKHHSSSFAASEAISRGTTMDMPETSVDENAEDVWHVPLTMDEMKEVGTLLKEFCKEYVLLDTKGMKTSMSYNELNAGPDYEHYDRKLLRKRYWLSIRQAYELVKDIIWPSDILERNESKRANNQGQQTGRVFAAKEMDDDGTPEGHPILLEAGEMFDILVWLEAASTFCVRSWRAYDYYDKEWFTPLPLSREVQVLGRRVKENPHQFFFPFSMLKENQEKNDSVPFQHSSDRLIACIGLCQAHGVPLSCFFYSFDSETLSSCSPYLSPSSSSAFTSSPSLLTQIVSQIPPEVASHLLPKDVIRILYGICRGCPSSKDYYFSTASKEGQNGITPHTALLRGLAQLCAVFTDRGLEALENVNEDDLCVMLQFMLHIKEGNRLFFSMPIGEASGNNCTTDESWNEKKKELCAVSLYSLQASPVSPLEEYRKIILRFEELCLARCRYLLYHLGGPQTVVLSGDHPFIPLIDFQKHKERPIPMTATASGRSHFMTPHPSTPQTLLHYRIGKEHAQGLRRVSLQSKSVEILTFISRLQSFDVKESREKTVATSSVSFSQPSNSKDVQWRVTELVEDMIQHIASHASSSVHGLTLSEVVRLLPILAQVAVPKRSRHSAGTEVGQPDVEVRGEKREKMDPRYQRLFDSISTAIGEAMQRQPRSLSLSSVTASSSTKGGEIIVALLEGLARCHFIPSTFSSVEMVLIRHCLLGHLSFSAVRRALMAWLTLKGTTGIPATMLHAVGSLIAGRLEKGLLGICHSSSAASVREDTPEGEPRTNVRKWDSEGKEMLDVLRVMSYCRYPSVTSLVLRIAEMDFMDWGKSHLDGHSYCVLGILFTFAGESISSVEREKSATLFDFARAALHAGVASLPSIEDTDVVIDTLLSFASLHETLHLSPSLKDFLSMFHVLHREVSPTHAAHVLEGLEILKLHTVSSALYRRYACWLVEYFQPLISPLLRGLQVEESSIPTVSFPTEPMRLSASECAAVLHLSQLQHLTPELKKTVIALLRQEISSLEKERELCIGKHPSNSSGSFELVILKRKETLRDLENDIVKACSALYQINGGMVSL